MGRRPTDVYAELDSAPALAARMAEKGIGVRRLARYADHRSHAFVSKLVNGTARTATPRTATLIEEALDCRGLLFTLRSVKSPNRTGL